MRFSNRADAGRRLADVLASESLHDPLVLGLPRGGVPVAAEVANRLGAPLDVIVVRKIGFPGQPELAAGAVGEGGVVVWNREALDAHGYGPEDFAAQVERERGEVARRAAEFRRDQPPRPIDGLTAIVVDDGLATGATARAACAVVRAHGAAKVVLAVPVAPAGWESRFSTAADRCVCVYAPTRFSAVGQFYDDFDQTSNTEVVRLLSER